MPDFLLLFGAKIDQAAKLLRPIVKNHEPILVCGNGGSASDSEHLVAELVGAFAHRDRPPINAISLVSNAAVVTAIGNDYGFDDVFSRQVWAHCASGHGALVAFSTSGKSPNVLSAITMADELGLPTILFTRYDQTRELPTQPDVIFDPMTGGAADTQQAHLVLYHALAGELEKMVL